MDIKTINLENAIEYYLKCALENLTNSDEILLQKIQEQKNKNIYCSDLIYNNNQIYNCILTLKQILNI